MSEIRSARRQDRTSWLRMRNALWPGSYADHAREIAAYFEGRLWNPLEVLIVFGEEGSPIGFAELSIRNYAEGCRTTRVAYLEGWYVDEGFRRRGYGRALVEAAEGWARRNGCVEFGSDALLENETSRDAHRALGFEETVRIRCFRKALD